MEMFSFEKLVVYKKAKTLVCQIYRIIEKLPSTERYALSDQIRRAAISITSNIAEQCGRTSPKEKIHFLEIAYGSMLETYSHLQISVELNYIKEIEVEELKPLFDEIARLLSGLKQSYKNLLTPLNSKH